MAGPAAVPGVDPSRVSTPDELAACLDGLRRRRGLSYEAMEKAAAKLPSRSGGSRLEPLPKSTVGEIVTGKRLPAKGKLLTFLAVCEVAPADLAQWLAAWERASTADLARPAGGVRVRDARPRLLGVHAAISVPGVPDDVPPQYVPRDADAAEFGIRARVEAAAQRGGFVLLVGGSSVGKTRSAARRSRRCCRTGGWCIRPGPARSPRWRQAPTPRTVVWLDELQRYLDGEHGLTGGVVRALLNAPHPAVIIGTLWPDRYAAYTTVPAPGGADPHAREREVLDLAAVIRIDPEFSPAEQDRARAAAARDRRLAVALGAAGYGLTQTLAAAPQLVARWEDAQAADPYAWAVLTAALDAARLGARAPLSADLLRAAAPGYCTSQQQAEAPDNWFEQALAYATDKLHGAAAALSPAGSRHGPARWVHRGGLPDPARQPGTPLRPRARQHLGRPAQPRPRSRRHRPARGQRQGSAAVLLRHPAVPVRRRRRRRVRRPGSWLDLLVERGDLDQGTCRSLQAPADAGLTPPGSWPSCWPGAATWTSCAPGPTPATRPPPGRLAGLLAERGDLDELRARADAGDGAAARQLAGLLAGPRGPGRAARPGRRRRRGRRPGGWPSCWPSAGTWTSCAPGPTPATGTPPTGWPSCWPSAGTWTSRQSARPGRRRRLGTPPGGWPSCWPSAGTWTSCAPGPTPATGTPPGSWPSCWPSAGTWTSCAPGPTPATGTPPGQLAELLAERGDLDEGCAPGPTPATGTSGCWPGC